MTNLLRYLFKFRQLLLNFVTNIIIFKGFLNISRVAVYIDYICLLDGDEKVTKLSTPVQCSNEEEYKLPPPLDLESILSGNSQADNLKSVQALNFTSLLSGDPHTDNLTPVQGDKGFIQDIHDVEITNAKAVVKAKDKNEDETDLKKRYQTASALSVEENSKS